MLDSGLTRQSIFGQVNSMDRSDALVRDPKLTGYLSERQTLIDLIYDLLAHMLIDLVVWTLCHGLLILYNLWLVYEFINISIDVGIEILICNTSQSIQKLAQARTTHKLFCSRACFPEPPLYTVNFFKILINMIILISPISRFFITLRTPRGGTATLLSALRFPVLWRSSHLTPF